MSYYSSIDSITIFSRYSNLEEVSQDYITSPLSSDLILKNSLSGVVTVWLYRAVHWLFSIDIEEIRLRKVSQALSEIFQEMQFFEMSNRGNLSIEEKTRKFYHLSSSAQMIYGASLDRDFAVKTEKVFFQIMGSAQDAPFSFLQEKWLATEVFSYISGIPSKETESVLSYIDTTENIKKCIESSLVQNWIQAINQSCIGLFSPHILTALASSTIYSQGLTNWSLLWKLYHAGLKIGTSGRDWEMASFPIEGDSAHRFEKNIAFSCETRELGVSWYSDRTLAKEKAIITTSIPLLFGLWAIQGNTRPDIFLFPPLPLYSVAKDGQQAVVEKPICFFSSSKIWEDSFSQKAILSFLSYILSLSFTPSMKLHGYCIRDSGAIASLVPLSIESDEFSWNSFERLCTQLSGSGNDESRLQWIYSNLHLSKHPDIVWMKALFLRYGLSCTERDIFQEMSIGRMQLKKHATKLLGYEVVELKKKLQHVFSDLNESGYTYKECDFIEKYFALTEKHPLYFIKPEHEIRNMFFKETSL